MNSFLIFILSLTSIFAIYWVLAGQWKHNAMLRQANRKIKAVLFDMDGVLIDSYDAWFETFNETRKEHRLDGISKEEFDRIVWGGSTKAEAQHYFNGIPEKKLKESYRKKMEEKAAMVKVDPYAHFVLSSLAKKGLKTGIVTNADRHVAGKLTEDLGIKAGTMVFSDDVKNPKPAPDGILKACKNLSINPEEAAFVGDTVNDMSAARAAGCFAIGLNTDGDLKIGSLKDLERMF